uniref:Uncharacterized protein n=1 Tax=Siphoviridae sp. ctss15 TaxID=2825699 RepID=A0A8S5TRI2_9CAUD|nr:MAG TPA: hypothetical protein [Siphoviridae sp. ctss15]
MEVIASCPHATQPMVNALLQTMKGYQYQAYEAGAANIDPAAELGDGVTVGGIYSPLSKLSDDGRGYAGISSPGEAEMEDEYPSEGYITQEFNRKIAETRSLITKTSEEINLKVEGIDGRVSDITQTVDGISLSVTSASSPDGQTTATITLKVGPNNYTGYIKLDGNVDVSGQLSADALYSAFGEIADLSVNRLSTSRRVVKYLAGDTSDDNFIRVAEQSLEFVAGIAKSTTEQAKNPNGELIYWEADPAGASIGADGYPYANGERIFTTTKQTSWPVMVYQYEEQVKRAISFQSDGQYYYPVDVFGAGDNNGKQRGYLVKRQNSLELTYETSTGKQLGLAARDEGYLDLMGMRRTVGLNFSGWDKGSWGVLLEGVKEMLDYGVTLNSAGVPVKITYPDGTDCPIYW